MLKRKKKQELCKQIAVTAKAAIALKVRARRVSAGPAKLRKKPAKSRKRTVNIETGLQVNSSSSIEAISSAAVDAADVAVAEVPIMNRRGRVVTLPQRFRG